MTMLDKAARAICAHVEERDDVWDDLFESEREQTRAWVRVALQALREPDPEIADGVMHHFADPCWPADAAKGFTAMIDAILAEGDKTT